MTTLAEQLADHFHRYSRASTNEASYKAVQRLLLDYLGVGVNGSQSGSGKVARRFAVDNGGRPTSSIIGETTLVPAVHAAFANAISSHSIELDDIDVLALFHFSPPVFSAALAVAQEVKATGAELLLALAAGCEMMERVSRAANSSLRNRGFHTTPTTGVFGATIAAAVLLKLDPEQIVSALGMAGAQSSGLMEMYGPSMQKRFNPGPAARNGVTAASMAKLGFTGAATIFEGERGFLAAFTDERQPQRLVEELGSPYQLDIEFKPYSCARPIHNAIDCALEIRKAHAPDLQRVKAIRMQRHPDWALYHQNKRPTTYHEAQVSLPYSVAVALTDGQALFAQYSNSRLEEPMLRRLGDMVAIEVDASLPRGVSCRMTMTMDDGSQYVSQVDYPKGSIQNSMSDAELRVKFDNLTIPVLGAEGSSRLASAIEGIAKASSVDDMMRATSGSGQ